MTVSKARNTFSVFIEEVINTTVDQISLTLPTDSLEVLPPMPQNIQTQTDGQVWDTVVGDLGKSRVWLLEKSTSKNQCSGQQRGNPGLA